MILFVEGPRHCGKTYLINRFLEQNTDPRFVYYKFHFVNWVNQLGFKYDDTNPSLHYLSLGNILTVMEKMNGDKSKIVIFDRGLFSCYVWSQLRRRIPFNIAMLEIESILSSDVYNHCRTLFIEPSNLNSQRIDDRGKDIWDNMHPSKEEYDMFRKFIDGTIRIHTSIDRNTSVMEMFNTFTENDVQNFQGTLYDCLSDLS